MYIPHKLPNTTMFVSAEKMREYESKLAVADAEGRDSPMPPWLDHE